MSYSRISGYDRNLLYYMLGLKESKKPVKLNKPSQPSIGGVKYNTKTTPAMSEEKFREAIVKQAQSDAANGVFGNNGRNGYMALQNKYISVFSPNRKRIISASVPFLFRTGRVTFAAFKDGAGNEVAHYSENNGWTMIMTPAERARSDEFSTIYNDAWRAATAKIEALK